MAVGQDRSISQEQDCPERLLGLDYPDDEQERIIRKFLKLRYKLMPYIYTFARCTYDTGLPLTRPLMVEYEDDVNCNANQYPYQYTFGDSFLVCPVYDNAGSMKVYLPKGQWVDYNAHVSGGQTITVDTTDLSVMPLFVKSGAIIACCEPKGYIDCANTQPLLLEIFGFGADHFTLYEDDGISMGYQTGEFALTQIISSVTQNQISLEIKPHNGSFPNMAKSREVSVTYLALCNLNGKTISVDNSTQDISVSVVQNGITICFEYLATRGINYTLKIN